MLIKYSFDLCNDLEQRMGDRKITKGVAVKLLKYFNFNALKKY